MWLTFKLTNFFWLLTSTYIWITALFNLGPILIVVNAVMLICLGMLPFEIKIDRQVGLASVFILAIMLWVMFIDGAAMGFTTLFMYMPVLYLIVLPHEYQKDLLSFSTKWYAILLIPSLLEYWITLYIDIPKLGMFEHPNYVPYTNYGFFIKTTWDSGNLTRFNAFFLEPGHQSLLSAFILMANQYRTKECKWLWVLVVSIIFSFSLAGYLLAILGYILLRIKSIVQIIVIGIAAAGLVIVTQNISGGNNAVNDLIISRLERDESNGIKGNNRFAGDTDFVFERSLKSGEVWTGVKNRTNMDLIAGAGYKIYIINYGLIGTLLALGIYLSVIPTRPDYRYTLSFLAVLILCFLQRAYPSWYSWLFPYIIGIYLAKHEKDSRDSDSMTTQPSYLSSGNEA